MAELKKKELDRRSLVKGAAWTAPALAAAVATPLSAASEPEPECPGCLKPGLGAFTLSGLAASNRATLAFASPAILDATDCGSLIGNIFDFQPAFTYVVTKAQLTMSDGKTYQSNLGVQPGAGVLGAVGVMAGVHTFSNVRVNNSTSIIGLAPQIRPTKLTITINTTLKWGLGAQIICPNTLVWDLSKASVGASLLIAGNGVVTYDGFSLRG